MTKLQMYSEETGNPLTIEWRIYSVPQVRPEAPMDDQPKTYGGRTINVYDAIRQICNTMQGQHIRNKGGGRNEDGTTRAAAMD